MQAPEYDGPQERAATEQRAAQQLIQNLASIHPAQHAANLFLGYPPDHRGSYHEGPAMVPKQSIRHEASSGRGFISGGLQPAEHKAPPQPPQQAAQQAQAQRAQHVQRADDGGPRPAVNHKGIGSSPERAATTTREREGSVREAEKVARLILRRLGWGDLGMVLLGCVLGLSFCLVANKALGFFWVTKFTIFLGTAGLLEVMGPSQLLTFWRGLGMRRAVMFVVYVGSAQFCSAMLSGGLLAALAAVWLLKAACVAFMGCIILNAIGGVERALAVVVELWWLR